MEKKKLLAAVGIALLFVGTFLWCGGPRQVFQLHERCDWFVRARHGWDRHPRQSIYYYREMQLASQAIVDVDDLSLGIGGEPKRLATELLKETYTPAGWSETMLDRLEIACTS